MPLDIDFVSNFLGSDHTSRPFIFALLLILNFYYLSFGGVLLYALYAVHAGSFCLVALGYGYYLAVSRLEAETELAGLVGIYFKLGMGKLLKAFHRLVLYAAFTALAYAFYAVEACVLAFVTLGSGYHLAVSRLKIEYKTRLGGLYYKLAHL